MNKPLSETMAFEDMVRRIAEAVWRLEPGEVQPAWYRDDPVLRELDGIARLPDVTHLIMVTTSTRLKKVIEDVQKLDKAEQKEKVTAIAIKKWMITEQQLNAEHIEHARKHHVEILTLDHFRDRFFNGREYLSKRRTGMFGSARNLQDGSISIPDNEYVELPMVAKTFSTIHARSREHENHSSIGDIVKRIERGEYICLVGPFGAGKSLSAREVFFALSKSYSARKSRSVPLAINLREHWGALYSDEVLERHARNIGFTPKETLTMAWRAGITHIIIDGFDEVATQAIARPTDRHFMRNVRYEALQATRDIVSKAPSRSGILICGRDHYFDDVNEMRHALGLTGKDFTIIRIGEFTEEKASEFLRNHSATDVLPDWLPRKPLLLGYLAHQKLLDEVLSIDSDKGFGFVWDAFLGLVCDREAQHERGNGSTHNSARARKTCLHCAGNSGRYRTAIEP